MFAATWIRGRTDLTPNARIVLTCLVGRRDAARWRRRRDIQEMARLSDDLTLDALNELMTAGLVAKDERPGTRWPIPIYRPTIAARITLPGWWTSRSVSNDLRFIRLVMEGLVAPSINQLRPYTATPKRPKGWSRVRLAALLKEAQATRVDLRDDGGRYEAHRYALPRIGIPNAPNSPPPSGKVGAKDSRSSTASGSRSFSSGSQGYTYHNKSGRKQRYTPEGTPVFWTQRPGEAEVLSMADAIKGQMTGAPTVEALKALVYNFGYAPAYLLSRVRYVRQQKRIEKPALYFFKAVHGYRWETHQSKPAAKARVTMVVVTCTNCRYQWGTRQDAPVTRCPQCGASSQD